MLSKRLEKVAHLVRKKAKVFDVGCDHGYLSIYLAKNNKNKVIASDITTFSVNKTIENVNKNNLSDKIEVIKSNGLENLTINKEDIIIISGMGTNTMLNIFYENRHKLSNTLILQSNNNHPLLRYRLRKLGYYIDAEEMVIDQNKVYIIIKFEKGRKHYSYIDYILGPILKYNKEYLNIELDKNIKIYNHIPNKYIIKRIKLKYIIKKIKKFLNS
ncbi:MAG: SAM-dependent methyltransferase [Bacilli bacterium]|nr:SAM-dependent methyltransferase [Bacilli bacterium]